MAFVSQVQCSESGMCQRAGLCGRLLVTPPSFAYTLLIWSLQIPFMPPEALGEEINKISEKAGE